MAYKSQFDFPPQKLLDRFLSREKLNFLTKNCFFQNLDFCIFCCILVNFWAILAHFTILESSIYQFLGTKVKFWILWKVFIQLDTKIRELFCLPVLTYILAEFLRQISEFVTHPELSISRNFVNTRSESRKEWFNFFIFYFLIISFQMLFQTIKSNMHYRKIEFVEMQLISMHINVEPYFSFSHL